MFLKSGCLWRHSLPIPCSNFSVCALSYAFMKSYVKTKLPVAHGRNIYPSWKPHRAISKLLSCPSRLNTPTHSLYCREMPGPGHQPAAQHGGRQLRPRRTRDHPSARLADLRSGVRSRYGADFCTSTRCVRAYELCSARRQWTLRRTEGNCLRTPVVVFSLTLARALNRELP